MQNISTLKSFSKKNNKSKTSWCKQCARKDIVSDADSKILNENIGELDKNSINQQNQKKRLAVDTILVIYLLGIMIVVIYFCHQKVMKKMPLTEGDVEKYYSVPSTALSKGVKEGKGLKIVTLNKLLSKVIILLSQIKPGNNSIQKHVIRKIVYLLYQHNKIPNTLYKNLIK